MKRHFTKEGIQMTNEYIKIYSASLVIREIQIKTIMRYHCTSNRMAKIKKRVIIPNAGEDVEKLDHPFIADGIAKWYS